MNSWMQLFDDTSRDLFVDVVLERGVVPGWQHAIDDAPLFVRRIEGFGHVAKIFSRHVNLAVHESIKKFFDFRYFVFGQDVI